MKTRLIRPRELLDRTLEAGEDEEDAVVRRRLRDPAKVRATDLESSATARPGAADPGKMTRVTAAAPPMTPEASIGYAGWLLDPARGWSSARIDRRAEAGAELGDEGALGSAFQFIADAQSGASLPEVLRKRLADQLGADLSGVRIHTDARAAKAASAVRARAFTIGQDIYFAENAYDPTSDAGVELIAHEVAHVAQNQRGTAAPARRISQPGDSHERDADAFARRFTSRLASNDPAALVDRVRSEGQRIPVPFLSELERRFGTSFDFVETYTGDAARAACALMSASAFAVRNIVALADPSPQRDTLLHELAHVVQTGGRSALAPAQFEAGSLTVGAELAHAESDARAAMFGGAVRSTADPNMIHRDGDKAPAWNIDDAVTRVQKYVDDQSLVPRRSGADPVFCKLDDETTFYDKTSADRWQRADYVAGIKGKLDNPKPSDDDLGKDLAAVHPTGRVSGLVQVGGDAGKSWGWIDPTESPPTNVKYMLDSQYETKSVGEKYDIYRDALSQTTYLKPPKPKLQVAFKNNTTITFQKKEKAKPETDSDLKKARGAIVDAALEVEEYKLGDKDEWDTFFKDVIDGPSTKFPNQGDLFAAIAARDIGTVNRQEVRFESKRLSTPTKERNADGFISGNTLRLTEFKSGPATPGSETGDGDLIAQARDYAKILRYKMKATRIDPPTEKGPFEQVAYFFPTKEMSETWAPKLKAVFKDEGGQDGRLRVFPPAKGSGVATFKFNPSFDVPLPEGSDQQTSFDIASPGIMHPGINFTKVHLVTGGPGSPEVKSGSVTFDADLAGGMSGKGITKQITGGQADNNVTEMKSSLGNIFKDRVKVSGGLTDDGVKGTLTVSAGPSGIPKINLDESTINATYTAAGLAIDGDINLSTTDKKIHGSVKVGWDGANWSFKGTATVEQGVVKGLDQFTAIVEYSGGKWTFGVDTAKYTQKLGAITLTGTASGVRYDVDQGDFGGLLKIDADLGMFGKASASAELAHNKLKKAVFSYDSPELKYPAKSDKPTFIGTIGGTLTYENEQFSGAVRGTANLNLPALQKIAGEGGLGLSVNAHINADGSYGGTISTNSALKFGDHFQIPSISCTIADTGDVSGTFSIEVMKFKYLEKAKIGCAIDKDGFKVTSADIKVPFGTEGDKFWGSLAVTYAEGKGLQITGDVSYKIKEGMVAHGTLTYSTETNEVKVELSVDKIQLFDYQTSKTLFTFSKQIPLVSIYGLGIYLDLGFDLIFGFDFNLAMSPKITLDGLSLETFTFKSISADIALLGAMIAKLTAQPKVGLGIFALSPSLLRGGGGIKIPITGEAALKPSAHLHVQYAPDGGVTGDASIGMSLQFGIKGAVKPYAELSVLDGAWNPSWEGDNLTEFEIMPPKELFNFTLDMGGDMKKKDPVIPDQPGPPSGAGGGTQIPQEKPVTKEAGGGNANKDAEPQGSGPSGDGGGLPDEPLKLGSLLSGLKGLPGYQTISKILAKAGAAWDAIKGFFGRVVKTFKSWFDTLAGAMEEIIDGFTQQGLGYLPTLIKKLVGDSVWNIIEPIVTAIGGVGDKLLDLFESEPPTSLGDFFPWALRMMSKVWGLAWSSIGSVVSAIGTMFDRLAQAAVKIITGMVQQGQIGVRRHTYYVWNPVPFSKNWYFFAATEYKINLMGFSTSFKEDGMITNPKSVVGVALWEALEAMGVPPTGGYDDADVPGNSRDRWV